MRLDSFDSYKAHFDYAMSELIDWRQRYSPEEYPRKVFSNTLYRLYSVNFMWDTFINAFRMKKPPFINGYEDARVAVSTMFKSIKQTKTLPVLEDLMRQKQDVADYNFEHFAQITEQAVKNKDNKSLEELEFVYVYYAITVEYLFRWFALAMIETSKSDALTIVSGKRELLLRDGRLLSGNDIYSFKDAMQIISAFSSSYFMNEFYDALPE